MTATTIPNSPAQTADTSNSTSTRQPAGLKVIFFTEMWERFSYYGMRALLVLYLVNSLGYDRQNALALYGLYTGLVYLTPMIGGALADKYLGKRRAAVIGALVMVMGHFAMAFEPLLHVALGLLIVGNGFFKANTTSMVGDLYNGESDPRRAGGYSIFYMGINLGAFLAPVVAGTLGEKLGWHYGFGAAGVGMTLGLVQLLWGQRLLGRAGLKPGQEAISLRDTGTILTWAGACVALVYGVLAGWSVIGPWHAALPAALRALLSVAVIGAILWTIARPSKGVEVAPLTKADFGRVVGMLIVMVFVIAFWTGFEQAGGTMNLFADKQTDRDLFGFNVPASLFQSINPLVIVMMAPVFAMLWTRMDQSRFALSDIAKQAIGMVVLGSGFLVMAQAQNLADLNGKVGAQWLAMVYVIHTIGELMLSPVGLSMVSRIAPARLAALLMGVWFLANAAANYLAGSLEHMLEGSGMPLYPFLAALSIGAGLVLLLITPLLNRLMGLGKSA
ncbi:peptide MFS transporter [Roseateles oligotrophus]|uniref:Peptide MFS transporter n=1 Tax=Roseateles oligotrophus TaxID=1769250 RepID=A0ABT2YM84_9BURK|nr:peptide MFS transporter [Roseateles oligotrophus]MCV2371168.1 peptide MFS transporter [Roseateles oligotrophus]